jgi:hypothetical protein
VTLQLLFQLDKQFSCSKFTAILLYPGFNRSQRGPELLPCCPHRNQRFACPAQSPAEFKAEKGEAVIILCLEAGELDHLCFLDGQLQQELSQAFTENLGESPLIFTILKTADKVVCKPHQHYIAAAAWFHNLLKPEIKRIMKVDIGKYGRDYAAFTG